MNEYTPAFPKIVPWNKTERPKVNQSKLNGRGSKEERQWNAVCHKINTCALTGLQGIEMAHIRAYPHPMEGVNEFNCGWAMKPHHMHSLPLYRELHKAQEAMSNEEFFRLAGFPFCNEQYDPRIFTERLYENRHDELIVREGLMEMRSRANQDYLSTLILG